MIEYIAYFTTGHSVKVRSSIRLDDSIDLWIFGPRGGYKTVVCLREEDLDKLIGVLTETLVAIQERE